MRVAGKGETGTGICRLKLGWMYSLERRDGVLSDDDKTNNDMTIANVNISAPPHLYISCGESQSQY